MLIKIASASCYKKQPPHPSGSTTQKNLFLAPKKPEIFPVPLLSGGYGSRLRVARSQQTAYAVTWKGEQNHERSHRWFSGQSWKWRTSLPLDQDLIHSPIKRKLGNGDAQKEAAGLCHRYTTGPGHFIILCKSSSNIHLF